jgi:hypothetical protein
MAKWKKAWARAFAHPVNDSVRTRFRGSAPRVSMGCRNIAHLVLLERQANLEYLDRKEGEFCVEAALDVCGLAKPVLLT